MPTRPWLTDPTGINTVAVTPEGQWYTIDGRKLSDKPSQKGIFIHNGRKVINTK